MKLAIDLMEHLIKRAPIPMAEMYRNLGNMYSTLLGTDSTAAEGMVRAWKVYLATSPTGDDGLAAIQAAVAKYERKK